MSPEKKISFGGLIFRGICSLFAGTAVVVSFIALLSLYGTSYEPAPRRTTQALKFPENEQMLDAMDQQLAREIGGLAAIEPAAGENTRPTPVTKSAPK
jgi:hypothetical protein